MAKITLPHTLANGNTADGGEVQANFDAVIAQVNGAITGVGGVNIPTDGIVTANIKDAAVTVAKLASTAKVIESVTHTPLTSNYSLTGSSAAFITQNINLSAQRYCLFLFSGLGHIYIISPGTGTSYLFNVDLYDDTTLLKSSAPSEISPGTSTIYLYSEPAFHAFKQLASGAHTIYVKGKYGTGVDGGNIIGDADGIYTSLTTIVFAF